MTPRHLFSADHFHPRVPHLALDPHPPFTRDGLAPPPPTPTAPARPHKAGVTFHRHTQSNLCCETVPKPRGQALPPPTSTLAPFSGLTGTPCQGVSHPYRLLNYFTSPLTSRLWSSAHMVTGSKYSSAEWYGLAPTLFLGHSLTECLKKPISPSLKVQSLHFLVNPRLCA